MRRLPRRVAGRRSRRRTRPGSARCRGALLGVPLLVAVASGCSTSAPAPAPDGRRHELPGFHVWLPDWVVEEREGDLANGTLSMRDPSSDASIQVVWSAPEREDLVSAVAALVRGVALAGGTVLEEAHLRVAGRRAVLLRVRKDDGEMLLTTWNCADQTDVTLVSLGSRPSDALASMHRRVLDGAACGAPVSIDPLFPVVELGETCVLERDGSQLSCAVGDAETYVFESADPGSGLPATIGTEPDMEAEALERSGFREVSFESRSTRAARTLVRYRARLEDLRPVWLVTVAWYCADEDVSFMATWTGEQRIDPERGIAALLSARCPSGAASGPPGAGRRPTDATASESR